MGRREDQRLAQAVAESALPLSGEGRDLDPLLELVGEARFVLIGEASHGTHEFYKVRAELTRRLLLEKGFQAVAVEGDWPDCFRVNRWVRGRGEEADAEEALGGFRRFPSWMWRNAEVLDFVGWLRAHNEGKPPQAQAGFYGLDLYSLHASMEAVLGYLEKEDPEAAQRARARYACFEHFREDPQAYGYSAHFGMTPACQQAVLKQLEELRQYRHSLLVGHDPEDAEEYLAAEMNARVAERAEYYYRTMFGGRINSWNVRDEHMADTLDTLAHFLGRHGPQARIVVWAHNSHVGDARATEMNDGGEWNIGQLVRERHPGEVALVGFSTYEGTVTAASDWDAPTERMAVRPGLPGSYEALFHQTGLPSFLLLLHQLGEAAGALREPRLQRAIGVVYRPQTERLSHYLRTSVPAQFDALIHIDRTRALEPVERWAEPPSGEAPETYPSGI